MRALFEYEGGSYAGGQDIFYEVGQVDGLPNFTGLGARFLIVHICKGREVGIRFAESGVAQGEEAINIPLLDIIGAGINVDRKVKEIRHGERRACLQHIEPL